MKVGIKLFTVILILFFIAGCAGGVGSRPFYKPVNFKNDDALQLWHNNTQYLTGGAGFFDNSVKVFVGNNGINEINGLIGVGLYVEIENNGDEEVIVLIKDLFIKDNDENDWQVVDLVSNDNIKETQTQTIGVNIKTYSLNNESGSVKVKDNNFYRVVEDVKVKAKSSKNFIVTLSAKVTKREVLAKDVIVSLKCQKGKELMSNSISFNSIEW